MSYNFIKKNIFLYFLTFFIVSFLCISHCFAQTKTIYSSADSSGVLSNSNHYLYGYLTGGGTVSSTTASVGSTISGVSYGFKFYLYEDINLQKTYTIRINFMSNDLMKEVNSTYFSVSTCTNSTCDEAVLISIEKQSYSINSSWVEFSFNPISAGNFISVDIGNPTSVQPITSVTNFGISSVSLTSTNANQDIIDNQTNNTNNIINNNNTNTNNIINNNNTNTNNIINNQNQNTQDLIDSQKVCKNYDRSNIITTGILAYNGTINKTETAYGITDFIRVSSSANVKVLQAYSTNAYLCYFDNKKELINCVREGDLSQNQILSLPSNISYIRFSIRENLNLPIFEICETGNNSTNNKLDDLNDNLNDDNTTGATGEASSFFSNFNTNTFGLTSIITAPLNLIQSLTSTTCSSLHIPLPFLNNKYLDLPCMSNIYSQFFGSFFTLYQTITFGIVAYWVCVRIFNQVKDFKNPEHDEIEVLDL